MDKTSVLIVEDDIYLLGLYARKFAAAGYDVYSARDGVEALRSFAKYHPDVMLVDLNIPEMNGWEVLAAVAEQTAGQRPPLCVVLSNYDEDTAREQEPLPSVVVAYFVKINTTPDEVIEKIKQLSLNR